MTQEEMKFLEKEFMKAAMKFLAEKSELEIYQDSKQEWRWRVKAFNGNIVAASTEGYKNKEDMIYNLHYTRDALNKLIDNELK